MDGTIRDMLHRIEMEITAKEEKYGIIDDNVRRLFSGEELEYIKTVNKSYTVDEIEKHMLECFDWMCMLDGEIDDEQWYDYYKEILKFKLK
ncbi:MAG: hypothetical protein RR292_03415 [Christensenellaceae bacterium]